MTTRLKIPPTLANHTRLLSVKIEDDKPSPAYELNKLCNDGGVRLLYDIRDTAQPIPHRAVLMQGHRLIAWVLSTGYETNADQVGELMGERMESLLFAPDVKGHSFHNDLCDLQLLATVRTYVGGGYRDDVRIDWNQNRCESLTHDFGLVRVCHYDPRGERHSRFPEKGVLVPKEKDRRDGWQCVDLVTAKFLAASDAKTPAFWTLPWMTFQFYTDDRVDITMTRMGAYLAPTNAEHHAAALTGATRFTAHLKHHSAGQLAIEATRHYSDTYWTLALTRNGEKYGPSESYEVVSGAVAVRLAELALLANALPKKDAAVDEAGAAEAFAASVHRVHQSNRKYKFVAVALGMEPAETVPA